MSRESLVDETQGGCAVRGTSPSSGPRRSPDRDALPPADTRRWVARRKAQVVTAVRDGRLSFEDACRRYSISHEEFLSWEQAIDRHGVGALRVTKLRDFRKQTAGGSAGADPDAASS